VSSTRKKSSRRNQLDQFDNQRTLLEALRVIFILIWFLYAFFLDDPDSVIQLYSFLIIVTISMINTAKMATQNIKNKEGNFYSQFGGLLIFFWFFLFIRIKGMTTFSSVTYFGIDFLSIFQFQKQFLGFALVVSSIIFNSINVKFIIKENKEKLNLNQLYISYSFRAIGLVFFFIVILTILTWLPYLSDIKVDSLDYLDIVLALGIVFLLIYAFSKSNSQKRRTQEIGKIAVYSCFSILAITYILPSFIEILSVIHYNSNYNTISINLWQNLAVFLFVFGIVSLFVSSSEKESQSFTNDLKSKAEDTFSDFTKNSSINKRSKRQKVSPTITTKPTTTKFSKTISKSSNSKTSELPETGSSTPHIAQKSSISSKDEKITIFIKILNVSSSNISLEKFSKKLNFNSIEDLEKWLIDLDLDYLQVNWQSSVLIFSEDLKNEVIKKFGS
jgi:hypothetical protein